jgi:biopolymer transport protein ExbD
MAEELSSAQRARIRRLSAPAEAEAAENGELNVVPYLDIVMNIMMFVLVTVSVSFASTIPTAAAGPVRPTEKRGLHLTALITREGVALKTAGGALAPGCSGFGAGMTVPSVDGAYDLASLATCARRVKNEGGPDETQVTVTASPNVPYEVVIEVMDALRADGEGALFPEVTLGAVR